MTAPLPKWVYDLVLDLVHQRDVHPQLLFTSGAFEGTAKYDWCPCNALSKVPADVVVQAGVLAEYLRASAIDWPAGETVLPTRLDVAGYADGQAVSDNETYRSSGESDA